jgi:DNA polymerase III epsilon subunit-like protein
VIVTIFDTETDGLINNTAKRLEKQPRILELFALTLRQTGEGEGAEFEEVEAWHSYFAYHRKEIPEETTRITGITNEDMEGAPKFKAKAGEMIEMFERSDRQVAHNISYDMQVVKFELERNSIEAPDFFRDPFCTVEATEHIKGFRLNLQGLHEHLFNEKFEGAHRAETDVRATARCYMELVRRGMA